MAYPWHPISLGGFIDIAKEKYGVTENRLKHPPIGPRGPLNGNWLERTIDGRTQRVAIQANLEDGDLLDPVSVGYMCRRLGMEMSAFGYTIPLDHGGFIKAPDDGSSWWLPRPNHS